MPVFYMPPLSWWSVFLKEENTVLFEQYENFPKQTYRNRANIYGANGKLSLIIPIAHNKKRAYHEIEISYRENWQQLHWKSIKTAYQSSAYFEFYEDALFEIYQKKTKGLLEFNLNAIETIQGILKTQKAYSLNNKYEKELNIPNYREAFSSKEPSQAKVPQYFQVFDEKYGFLEDLSIVDLLCNLGPESRAFLSGIVNN